MMIIKDGNGKSVANAGCFMNNCANLGEMRWSLQSDP